MIGTGPFCGPPALNGGAGGGGGGEGGGVGPVVSPPPSEESPSHSAASTVYSASGLLGLISREYRPGGLSTSNVPVLGSSPGSGGSKSAGTVPPPSSLTVMSMNGADP